MMAPSNPLQWPPSETRGWRERYPVHPAVGLLPMISEAELEELADDIVQNGLNDPIVLWVDNTAEKDGDRSTAAPDCPRLLDGRNRLEALDRRGSTLETVPLTGKAKAAKGVIRLFAWERVISKGDGDKLQHSWRPGVDPWVYVLSANVRRRHLTQEQRREVIGKLLQQRPDLTDNAIAKQVGMSHHTVAAVRAAAETPNKEPEAANWQIANKPQIGRVEASGRKARGRKPQPRPAPSSKPVASSRPPAKSSPPQPPRDPELSALLPFTSPVTPGAAKADRLAAVREYIEFLGLTIAETIDHLMPFSLRLRLRRPTK